MGQQIGPGGAPINKTAPDVIASEEKQSRAVFARAIEIASSRRSSQ